MKCRFSAPPTFAVLPVLAGVFVLLGPLAEDETMTQAKAKHVGNGVVAWDCWPVNGDVQGRQLSVIVAITHFYHCLGILENWRRETNFTIETYCGVVGLFQRDTIFFGNCCGVYNTNT